MDYVENKEDCMKATGIVRRIDDLGRIVIPKEIRCIGICSRICGVHSTEYRNDNCNN
mgnify:CR=1 FL=1